MVLVDFSFTDEIDAENKERAILDEANKDTIGGGNDIEGYRDLMYSKDIPTVFASPQTTIDVPVAEPTENSALLHNYIPREAFWD
jgi:hypothetical protein